MRDYLVHPSTVELIKVQCRAKNLRDQILKTWNPPHAFMSQDISTAIQTSIMQSLAFIFGEEFIPDNITDLQKEAIRKGLDVIEKELMQ